MYHVADTAHLANRTSQYQANKPGEVCRIFAPAVEFRHVSIQLSAFAVPVKIGPGFQQQYARCQN